jgi:integral membrane protein
VRAALTRYRVMAYVTGVFLLLLCLNMVLKYLLDQEGLGDWIPISHGWLYLGYVAVTVDLWFRTRLDVTRTAFVVLAGTIPFASFFAERWVSHQVQPLTEAGTGGRPASAAP